MARAKDLETRYITDTALAFRTNTNPIALIPFYVGGSNVMTSTKKFLERRPGFSAYTGDTFASSTVKRIFCWRRWNDAFFVMISVVTASGSDVYKRKIGTDATFVLLYSDTSSTEPFDFTVANNKCFFANGTQAWKYAGSGTTVEPWGIGMSGTNRPTTAFSGTGLDAVEGYVYVYTFGNSSTGHESNRSRESLNTGSFTDQGVTITCQRTTDTQVDKIHVYRTTDGGGGIFFELPNSPITHTPGAGTETITDTAGDVALLSNVAPVSEYNSQDTTNMVGINSDPFKYGSGGRRIKAIEWWQSRIWGIRDNILMYSGWEEVEVGVEEECYPDDNYFEFGDELTGCKASENGLMVFAATNTYLIQGDGVDNFIRRKLFSNVGCRERGTIASFGGLVAWLDASDIVRLSDGASQQDISIDIRDQLAGINHSLASMAFYIDGPRHWLILADGGNSKLYVYDLDMERWMPSWAVSTVSAIGSGETAAGVIDLLIGYNSTRVGKLTPATYEDFGSSYTASVVTNLWDLIMDSSPGHIGDLEYVTLERNSIALSDVLILTDDDPTTGSFVSINAAGVDVPLRTQGTNVVEKWYYHRTPACRRVSLKLEWAAANSNFKLYSLGATYNPMT